SDHQPRDAGASAAGAGSGQGSRSARRQRRARPHAAGHPPSRSASRQEVVMSEQLDVVLDDASLGATTKIGTLYRESSRSAEVISFAYDHDYLALPWAVAIDPELQLHPSRVYPAQQGGLFG